MMKCRMMIASAVLAACSIAGQPTAAQPPAVDGLRSQRPMIGLVEAVAIAERNTGGRIMEVELDHSRQGRPVYEIELVRSGAKQEIEIDARSGKVVSAHKPVLVGYWSQWFGDDEANHLTKARRLSTLLAGLERRSGGRVLDVSFDVEGGQAHYEVEISTRAGVTHIYLDPRTGQRLAMVRDD